MQRETIARHQEIRNMRRSGETLQVIGDRFGITRERVRQLTHGIEVEKSCVSCGKTFINQADVRLVKVCPTCHLCATCGKELSRTQISRGYRYCCARHNPGFKHAATGATYRAVVKGIYARYYLATGERIGAQFYCWNMNGKKALVPFDSFEDAVAYRASNVWRKPRERKVK